MYGRVELAVNRDGMVQTRYSPVGPEIVPLSVKPTGSEIVGHPAAGVTSDEVGVGVGVGVGAGALGLLMVMFPPVPGETISSAPQLASATALQLRTSARWIFVTGNGPLKNRVNRMRECVDRESPTRDRS